MTLVDAARAFRRSRWAGSIDWLWPALRIPYHLFLRLRSMTGGIPRTVNGRRFRFRYPFGKLVAQDYEPMVVATLRRLLRPGLTFFDVGASFGVLTLEGATLVGPRGKVYAFEPMAATVIALRDHLTLNRLIDRVEVIEAVVDEQLGEVDFWEPASGSSYTTNMMASMSPQWVQWRNKRGNETEVKTLRRAISIDEFCRTTDTAPDVLKIDVEGAEARVLRGASDFLSRGTGHILVEIHPAALETLGDSEAAVLRLLAESGWRYEELDRTVDAAGETLTRHLVCSAAA